jgi:hypothetical protein
MLFYPLLPSFSLSLIINDEKIIKPKKKTAIAIGYYKIKVKILCAMPTIRWISIVDLGKRAGAAF